MAPRRARASTSTASAAPSAAVAPCDALLTATANGLFAANALPSRSSAALALATSPALRALSGSTARRAAALAASVAARYGAPASPFAGDKEEEEDDDDGEEGGAAREAAIEGVFVAVVEAVDLALDQANAALDRAAGIEDAVVPSGALLVAPKKKKTGGGGRRVGIALDIPKPQLGEVDNSDALFVPLPPYGVEKATGSLAAVDEHLRELARCNAAAAAGGEKKRGRARRLNDGPHPCEAEIAAVAARMADGVEAPEATLFRPLDPPVLGVIESEEELFEAAQCMHAAPAISVDVEHHSVRSFQGFVCLLQISTREEDFIVDAIKLRGSIRRALAPVFADGRIVKVMHGADHDVEWLERDFGIYIVNLFDTGRAAKLLSYSKLSLAFLLSRFADVDVSNKHEFQIADWRQRPLPEAMVDYARSDTHYLLYIWDRLRSELKGKSLLGRAWEESAKVARIRYVKDRYDPNSSIQLASKYGLCYDAKQMRVLAEVCRWRDSTAREEDESVWYVMSNRVMFAIVRGRHNARTSDALLTKALKGIPIPPLVEANAEKLAQLISDALDAKVPANAIVVLSPRKKVVAPGGASANGDTGEETCLPSLPRLDDSAAAAVQPGSGTLSSSRHCDPTATERPSPVSMPKESVVSTLLPPVRIRAKAAARSALMDSSSDEDSEAEADGSEAAIETGSVAQGSTESGVAVDGQSASVYDLDSSDGSGEESLPKEDTNLGSNATSKPGDGAASIARSMLLSTKEACAVGSTRSSPLSVELKTAPRSPVMVLSSDEESEAEAGGEEAAFETSSVAKGTEESGVAVGLTASVFDLDSSDESEGETEKPDVQMVLDSFKVDTVRVPEHFMPVGGQSPAMDVQKRGSTRGTDALDAEGAEGEGDFVSLREQHQDFKGQKRQKKRRKSDTRHGSSAADPLGEELETPSVPYDYKAERQTRRKGKDGAADDAVYDPYSRFRHQTSKDVRRVKRVRKNPKSGERSLSFR